MALDALKMEVQGLSSTFSHHFTPTRPDVALSANSQLAVHLKHLKAMAESRCGGDGLHLHINFNSNHQPIAGESAVVSYSRGVCSWPSLLWAQTQAPMVFVSPLAEPPRPEPCGMIPTPKPGGRNAQS